MDDIDYYEPETNQELTDLIKDLEFCHELIDDRFLSQRIGQIIDKLKQINP